MVISWVGADKMKKRQWIVCFAIVVIIILGFVICKGFLKSHEETSENPEEIITDEIVDDTQFEPSSTEEERSTGQQGEASQKTEASGSTNIEETKMSNEESNSNTSESTNNENEDVESDNGNENNNEIELPFVPFE